MIRCLAGASLRTSKYRGGARRGAAPREADAEAAFAARRSRLPCWKIWNSRAAGRRRCRRRAITKSRPMARPLHDHARWPPLWVLLACQQVQDDLLDRTGRLNRTGERAHRLGVARAHRWPARRRDGMLHARAQVGGSICRSILPSLTRDASRGRRRCGQVAGLALRHVDRCRSSSRAGACGSGAARSAAGERFAHARAEHREKLSWPGPRPSSSCSSLICSRAWTSSVTSWAIRARRRSSRRGRAAARR